MGACGWVHRRVIDDGCHHVLLQCLIEHVLCVVAADLLEPLEDEAAVLRDELRVYECPASLLLLVRRSIFEPL